MLNNALKSCRCGCLVLAIVVASLCDSTCGDDTSQVNKSTTAKNPSPVRYGLDFNGKDAYVEVEGFRYDGKHPLTIEAIVLPHSERKASVFVDFERGGVGLQLRDEKWLFMIHDEKNYRLVAADEKPNYKIADHVAGVFDGKAVSLYVNGKIQSRKAYVAGSVHPSGLPFLIGANPSPSGEPVEFFHGRIDAVCLSKGERYTKNFAAPSKLEKTDSTLVLLNFNEGEGETAKDESGNGHDGKIQKAKWVKLPK